MAGSHTKSQRDINTAIRAMLLSARHRQPTLDVVEGAERAILNLAKDMEALQAQVRQLRAELANATAYARQTQAHLEAEQDRWAGVRADLRGYAERSLGWIDKALEADQ